MSPTPTSSNSAASWKPTSSSRTSARFSIRRPALASWVSRSKSMTLRYQSRRSAHCFRMPESCSDRRSRSCRHEIRAQDAVALEIDVLIPLFQMLAERSFVAHSDFLQHAPGLRIPSEMHRVNPVDRKVLEAELHHRLSRLGRVPHAPVRDADPVSDFSRVIWGFEVE